MGVLDGDLLVFLFGGLGDEVVLRTVYGGFGFVECQPFGHLVALAE